jgi:hypothetical protein
LTCVARSNIHMTRASVDQSGQGSAVERRSSSAATRYPIGRSRATLVGRVRPVRTPSLSVSGRSDSSEAAGRSLRGYGADDAQTPGENCRASSGVCEKQWADDRCDRDPRFGCVSGYAEKAWLSRAQRAARFKFAWTTGWIACTTQSSPKPTVFLCPFGSAPSAAV